MTIKRRRFIKGIQLDPDATSMTDEGELKYDSSSKKIQYRDDVGDKSVVSEDGTQTLENKTMDFTASTGNNTISADSNDIVYDNTTSGLTATNVKDAIDEIDTRLEAQDEASEISYDNSTSGLTATNVQDAIDEVEGRVDTLEGASYVNTFEGRSGTVTAQSGDYDANQVTYNNATSGLTATDTQAAIDEVEGRVDTLEGASYVNTFEGRSGTVTAQSGDYDANQITYSNATTGFTATDVQAAIDELDAKVELQDEASEITYSNATSGLTATNVQDAIDEIDSNLDTHIADTTTHGTTGDIVGTTDTQDLSNKTFTNPVILEEQGSTPANPSAGDLKLYAKNDSQLYILDSSGTETALGTGGNVLVAILKDSKAAGSSGGTSTSGSWNTRDLNVIEGPSTGFVSLLSNQFTLSAGTYHIHWHSPFVGSDQVRTRLRNITDGATTAASDCGFASSASTGAYNTTGGSSITIASSKTYEIQYRVQTGRTSDGLGTSVNFGEFDEFTQVHITKLA